MLETVKIRRAGFPVRRTFTDFYSRSAKHQMKRRLTGCSKSVGNYILTSSATCVCFCRYKMIQKSKIHSDDEKQSCTDLLTIHDKAKQEWQLGKTKVEHIHRLPYSSCPNLLLSLGSHLSLTYIHAMDTHSNHNHYAFISLSLTLYKSSPWNFGFYFVSTSFVPPNWDLNHCNAIQYNTVMHIFAPLIPRPTHPPDRTAGLKQTVTQLQSLRDGSDVS